MYQNISTTKFSIFLNTITFLCYKLPDTNVPNEIIPIDVKNGEK